MKKFLISTVLILLIILVGTVFASQVSPIVEPIDKAETAVKPKEIKDSDKPISNTDPDQGDPTDLLNTEIPGLTTEGPGIKDVYMENQAKAAKEASKGLDQMGSMLTQPLFKIIILVVGVFIVLLLLYAAAKKKDTKYRVSKKDKAQPEKEEFPEVQTDFEEDIVIPGMIEEKSEDEEEIKEELEEIIDITQPETEEDFLLNLEDETDESLELGLSDNLTEDIEIPISDKIDKEISKTMPPEIELEEKEEIILTPDSDIDDIDDIDELSKAIKEKEEELKKLEDEIKEEKEKDKIKDKPVEKKTKKQEKPEKIIEEKTEDPFSSFKIDEEPVEKKKSTKKSKKEESKGGLAEDFLKNMEKSMKEDKNK